MWMTKMKMNTELISRIMDDPTECANFFYLSVCECFSFRADDDDEFDDLVWKIENLQFCVVVFCFECKF